MKMTLPGLILLFSLASCQGGNTVDTSALIGTWRWDVNLIKEQVIKNARLRNDKEAIRQLDSSMQPLEILRMEFQKEGVVIAHIDSVKSEKGNYEFQENNKFLKTEIGGLPKYYQVKSITAEKVILLETSPKSPIRQFVLYPAKL